MNNPFETIDARLSNIENLLLDLKHTPKNSGNQAEPDLLTIKQASEFLNLSVPTLYTKVHHREIPVMKKGGKLYFSRSQLMSWLQEGQKATRQEIKEQAKNSIQSGKK